MDVVDSEFCTLQEVVSSATDFQSVLKGHKNFISTIMRLSNIDNVVVQEGIERVLQVCVRFIAVCRLLQQQEEDNDSNENIESNYSYRNYADRDSSTKYENLIKNPMKVEKKRIIPIVIPPEEIVGIRKDFFTQISYLFQIMSKVENRGLIFRLDFNGYLSALSEEIGSGL